PRPGAGGRPAPRYRHKRDKFFSYKSAKREGSRWAASTCVLSSCSSLISLFSLTSSVLRTEKLRYAMHYLHSLRNARDRGLSLRRRTLQVSHHFFREGDVLGGIGHD